MVLGVQWFWDHVGPIGAGADELDGQDPNDGGDRGQPRSRGRGRNEDAGGDEWWMRRKNQGKK